MADGNLSWCKNGLLHLLEQFVISSYVPNGSDMTERMGNPDTVFCILLLCPEIAACFEDSGSSSEGENEKEEFKNLCS